MVEIRALISELAKTYRNFKQLTSPGAKSAKFAMRSSSSTRKLLAKDAIENLNDMMTETRKDGIHGNPQTRAR